MVLHSTKCHQVTIPRDLPSVQSPDCSKGTADTDVKVTMIVFKSLSYATSRQFLS